MPLDLKATLTRKVGPLPVWAWGAAAGGGLLVLRKLGYIKSAPPAADSTGADTATVADGGGVGIEPPAAVSYWGGDGAALLPGSGGLLEPPGVGIVDPGFSPVVEVPEMVPTGPRPYVPPPIVLPTGRYGAQGQRLCPPGWHYSTRWSGCVQRDS